MARCVARAGLPFGPRGCFQPVARGKNREGRSASSTAKSRARQSAGPAEGHLARCQSYGAQRTPPTSSLFPSGSREDRRYIRAEGKIRNEPNSVQANCNQSVAVGAVRSHCSATRCLSAVRILGLPVQTFGSPPPGSAALNVERPDSLWRTLSVCSVETPLDALCSSAPAPGGSMIFGCIQVALPGTSERNTKQTQFLASELQSMSYGWFCAPRARSRSAGLGGRLVKREHCQVTIARAQWGQTILFVPAAARRLSRLLSRGQRGFSTPILGRPLYFWSHVCALAVPFGARPLPAVERGLGWTRIGRANGRSPLFITPETPSP